MPGIWQVRLSEALAIQGWPLDEQQIWAILSQAVQSLQDYLCRGEAVSDGEPAFIITPDTLFVCRGGNIEYGKATVDSVNNQDFIPPEMEVLQQGAFTEADVERMCVFSLGLTIYWGADYKLGSDQELELSELLDEVLSAMCEEDPNIRVPLNKLSEVCIEYRQKHPNQPPDSYIIRNLYMLLMGSSSDLDELERVQRQHRPSARNRSHHRSHTRSRSRSRSRSQDRHTHRRPQRKRPHPVGRDHNMDDRYADHMSAYSYDKCYPPPPAPYATVLPAHDYTYPYYSGFVGNIPTMQRRVLSELQPDIYNPKLPVGVIPPPEPWAGPGIITSGQTLHAGAPNQQYPAALGKEPLRKQQVEHLYGRLRDRGARLQALRQKLECEEVSDMTSLYSDLTDVPDHKSMLSGNSSTHGVFVPDSVHMTIPRPSHTSAQTLEDDWIKKQEAEIEAMIMAQNAFLHKTRDSGDGARSEPESSLPRVNQVKGHKSRPKSSDHAARTGRPQSAKSHERSHSRPRSRPFYGPEFVQDHDTITLHTPDARTLPPAKVRHLEVILLNGQRLDIICDVNVITKEVTNTVTSYLNLPEAFYFGLTHVHEGEHFFLESDAPIHKVAPKSWKIQNVGGLVLHLRVKFYTDVLNHLRHETTRHLYYLQVRRDLLEDRCWCTTSQATMLSALAVQAEYSDHVLAGTKNWTPDHYFPPRILRKIGKACARDQVMEKLKQFEGMSEKNAEIQYLKEAMLLPEYGIHFYRIHKSKSDTISSVWVGISVQGVLVAEQDSMGNRRVICRHAWSDTQKVSYNRRRFSIQPKPDPNIGKLPKLNFFTETYKISRYLTQLCTSHHRFQMMSRLSLPGNMTGIDGKDFDDNLDERYMSDSASSGNSPHHQYTDDEFAEADDAGRAVSPSEMSHPGRILSDPEQRSALSSDGLHQKGRPDSTYHGDGDENMKPKNTRCSSPRNRPSSSSSAHVLDVMEDTSVVPMSEVLNGNEILAYKSQARKVEIVRLRKDPRDGYGITIVGANNIGKLDFGVFIQSVMPGSPAASSGKIHPGDRLLAINGQSLEGIPHSMAVELIQDSPGIIELTLSQRHKALGVDVLLGGSEESLNMETAEQDLVITSDVHRDGQKPEASTRVNSVDPKPSGNTHVTHGDVEGASDEELSSFQNRQSTSTTELKPGDLYEIILQKKQGSFGLNITGGINTSVKHGGIYVKSLTKDGAAEQDGRISVGDRVIEVNSVSLMKVTHRQAVETLRSAPAICKLVLEKSSPLMGRQSQQNLTASSVGSPTSLAESPNSFCDTNTMQPQDASSMMGSSITAQVSLSPHNNSSMSAVPSGGKDLLMEFYPFVTKALY